jgi:uncharacterized protein YjbI with pentapeptide repeats
MSALFKNRAVEAAKELAGRKNEYETFKSIRLSEIIRDKNLNAEACDGSSLQSNDDFFRFDYPEYDLITFNSFSFGKEEAENNRDLLIMKNIKFYYCVFNGCIFSNIKFINCIFVGCTFSECLTMNYGLVFEDCNFSKNDNIKNSVDDMFSYFRFCELTVKFIRCDLSLNIFSKTNFYFSEFTANNMYNIIMSDCGFEITSLCDCNLQNAKIINTKFISFSFEDTYIGTKINRNTFFGELNYNKKDKRELRNAIDMYFSLTQLYQNNKISDMYGEYFYLFKKAEMMTLRGGSRFISFISYLVCGYGERPFYSLIVSILLTFVCGNLYYLFGLSTHTGLIQFTAGSEFSTVIKDLFYCYHFSLVTFSTVGYGNIVAVGTSVIVNEVEMILSILLVGIWVSTLVRKMVR